jgi:hypothetical protein
MKGASRIILLLTRENVLHLVTVLCAILPWFFLFLKPPLLPSSIPPPHLAGSSLPEAGISSPSALSSCSLLRLALTTLITVSTKGAKQANLFWVPAARLCVGTDQWVFYLLAEWSCYLCSSSPLAHGQRRHGAKPLEDSFLASWTTHGFQRHPACCGIAHEPNPVTRTSTSRMAREGPVIRRRYQGCSPAPRNAVVQPCPARSDHDHAVESNLRSSGCLRRIISSATCVNVAMWLVLRASCTVAAWFCVRAWVVFVSIRSIANCLMLVRSVTNRLTRLSRRGDNDCSRPQQLAGAHLVHRSAGVQRDSCRQIFRVR